jgi:hypothetical protein
MIICYHKLIALIINYFVTRYQKDLDTDQFLTFFTNYHENKGKNIQSID